MKARKHPFFASAMCTEPGCGAQCRASNAEAWAHNHANKHNHTVELQLGWEVKRDV